MIDQEERAMPFTPKFVDLVRNATTVTGTGPVTLGAAQSGYTGLAAAVAVGEQFYYCIQGIDKPAEREVGRGTMQANGTVARQPISGAATNFTSGAKTIALVTAAEWFSRLEQLGTGLAPVATRAALAALPMAAGSAAMLAEKGRDGLFVFDASNLSAAVAADPRQGCTVAPASDPSGASGAWVRRFSGSANVRWFGATGDGVTNDGAAFAAAIAYLKAAVASVNGAIYKGSQRLHVPAGDYFLGTTTLDVTHTLIIEGDSAGMAGGMATTLRWAAGATGFRIQRYNTSGDRLIVSAHVGGDATMLRGLSLTGGYTGTAGSFHAVDIMARCTIEDCHIDNWQGNGVNVVASATGGTGIEGNANGAVFNRLRVTGCLNGMFFNGADANACVVTAADCSGNRGWGFRDDSFLGNTFIGCHAATNVSGPYKSSNTNAATVILSCYSEADQPPSSLGPQTLFIGGTQGAGAVGGVFLNASSNAQLRVGVLSPERVQFIDPNQCIMWGANPEDPVAAISHAGGKSYFGSDYDGYVFRVRGSFTNYMTLDSAALSLAPSMALKMGGTTIVDSSRNGSFASVVSDLSGVGYASGAGGTSVQATSKSNGVTLNKACGQVTMNGAALAAATSVSFTLTNSHIAATDLIVVTISGGASAGAYAASVDAVATGSCRITLRNQSAATLSEAVVLNMAVLKGAAN
jgi:hypothetical protein